MTTTTTTTTMTAAVRKRHPIRGFLFGIVFGLGLAMIAIGQKWAALGTWPPFILVLAGIVVGTAWSTFGPAKAPKGQPPVADPTAESETAPAPDTAVVTVIESVSTESVEDTGEESAGVDTED